MTDKELSYQLGEINGKLDSLMDQFREYRDRQDKIIDRLSEQVNDLREGMANSERSRKATCPQGMAIAASAKGVNEIRDRVEALEDAPGRAALEDKKAVRNYLGLAALGFVVGKAQDILEFFTKRGG